MSDVVRAGNLLLGELQVNFISRKPLDLTPSQLQVYLHDEKQESWYAFIILLTAGAGAAAYWPAFAPVYSTYGGLMLAGLAALFGVNVAHKVLNNTATLKEQAGEDELPRASKT